MSTIRVGHNKNLLILKKKEKRRIHKINVINIVHYIMMHNNPSQLIFVNNF